MTSIRRRLLLSLLGGLLACSVVVVVIAYIDTTQEIGELFSGNLRRMALVLRGQAFPQTAFQPASGEASGEEIEETYIIQLWSADGGLLSSSAPTVAIPLQAQEGLSLVTAAGETWQVYMLKAGAAGFVQISQPQKIVATMVGESAFRALVPLIGLFVLLFIGAWFAVGRSLSPLATLSKSIAIWDPARLQALPVGNAPMEIQPVVTALNVLLDKLDKSMALQRQFTADAAHELRTPLTAIRLQLDVLLRSRTESEKQAALDQLSLGIERSIHLASQLLVSSRTMAGKLPSDFRDVPLDKLVRSSLTTFAALAAEKNIDVLFKNTVDWFISGDEDGLRILINNLLDNAIRYTPAGGEVEVRLGNAGQDIVLEVRDTGPGIPAPERERVFQRFYRIPGTASTGSGLGLAIVKAVADSHNARIELVEARPQKGAVIRILFPIKRMV